MFYENSLTAMTSSGAPLIISNSFNIKAVGCSKFKLSSDVVSTSFFCAAGSTISILDMVFVHWRKENMCSVHKSSSHISRFSPKHESAARMQLIILGAKVESFMTRTRKTTRADNPGDFPKNLLIFPTKKNAKKAGN